jgi:hypothetical protein
VFSNDLQDSNRIFNMGEWESVYRGAGGQGFGGSPNIQYSGLGECDPGDCQMLGDLRKY